MLVASFGLDRDPGLARLCALVHHLDIGGIPVPEAPGFATIMAGARAYLYSSDDPHTVRMAIEIVVSGSIWAPRRLLSRLIDRLLGVPGGPAGGIGALQLTARERQVLDLILLARSNREIAAELGIEERTVKAHVGRLMRKTGAENRIELSIRALNRRSAKEVLEETENGG